GPVDRVGDIGGGEWLPVGPLDVRTKLVRPGLAVVGAFPGRREPRNVVEVARRLVGERRVLDVPDLVVDHQDAGGRQERVDVLAEADRERDGPSLAGRGSGAGE